MAEHHDQDLIDFADEDVSADAAAQGVGPAVGAWRILIIDDDVDVHQATEFALQHQMLFGRPLQFLHAYSAQDARVLLRQEGDIALVLLDVVMETDDAGLTMVDFIRNDAGLSSTRIVLRTGQPGYAPEHETLLRYDINDYKTKSELTRHKLLTTITTAVRSYEQLKAMEAHRQGLEMIVQTSGSLMLEHGLQQFALGVVHQLAAMLQTPPDGLVCTAEGGGPVRVLAGAGRYAGLNLWPDEDPALAALQTQVGRAMQLRTSQYGPMGVCLFLSNPGGGDLVVYVASQEVPGPTQQRLLEVLGLNLGMLLRNHNLVSRLHAHAYSDPLLGIPNRTSFEEELDLRIAERQQAQVVALLDIDDFSATNDVMGHQFGDQMLMAISRRLRESFPEPVVIARLDGDVFGLLGARDWVQPERLMACLRMPVPIEGIPHVISMTSSFISVPEATGSGAGLLNDAALALKLAKREHKGQYLYFTDQMGAEARARAQLLSQLRKAFDDQGLFLVYQPQMDLASGACIGLEALMRWRQPDGQFVPPDRFIPVAEQSGLMVVMGQWVLDTACRAMRELLDLGLAPQRMAVNVSVMQFNDPGFRAGVARALAQTGLTGQHLELEITESVAVLPSQLLETTLADFRAQGISVAIDDFGTGYSSLSYLENLPLDRIKIDRSFVKRIGQVHGPCIAEVITQLGRNLNLQVLAEGVEDQATADALARMGCHEGQGYHFARPLEKAALIDWLAQRRPA